MLDQVYFGFPLWSILLVVVMMLWFMSGSGSCGHKSESSNQNTNENKEKFTDVATEPTPKSNSETKIKVYNFNTSWCGWSQKFEPHWAEFTNYVKDPANKMTHIEAIDVKCDRPENEEMCSKYNVPGYPFVLIEGGGKRIPFKGNRTKDGLVEHLDNMIIMC